MDIRINRHYDKDQDMWILSFQCEYNGKQYMSDILLYRINPKRYKQIPFKEFLKENIKLFQDSLISKA